MAEHEKIEFKKFEENPGRCRSGEAIYETLVSNGEYEKFMLINLNHRAKITEKGIEFERWDNWDYQKHPIGTPICSIFPNNGLADIIIKLFNDSYVEHERRWKANCKKPYCNSCMACE